MKKIILLGGVPGTGKTTIAYELALKIKVDKVISIDCIKQILKQFISKDKEPYLYTTTHESYLIENIGVIEGYLQHSNVLNSYMYEIAKNFDDNILIIEGATVNKELEKYLRKKQYDVVYFNINVPKKELIERYKKKENIRKGKWIKNIEIIEEIANYLRKNADINVENIDLNLSVERIVENVGEILYR